MRTGFRTRWVSSANGESLRPGQIAVGTGGALRSRVAVFAEVAQRCTGDAVSDKFNFSFTPA